MGRRDVLAICNDIPSPDRARTKLLRSCSHLQPGSRKAKDQPDRLRGQASSIAFLLHIFRSAPNRDAIPDYVESRAFPRRILLYTKFGMVSSLLSLRTFAGAGQTHLLL